MQYTSQRQQPEQAEGGAATRSRQSSPLKHPSNAPQTLPGYPTTI